MLLLASPWLFTYRCALAEQTLANANLLKNPSFEDTAGAGADEELVPGWNLRFRAKETEPALTAEEVSIVDDPAQAHSGRRCLRIQPRSRNVELFSPVPQVRFYDPGLYEISAWVRGRPGTRGFFGTYALRANNFWGVTTQWRKIQFVEYFRGGNNSGPMMLTVWKEGERDQAKDPVLFIDDVTIIRLTSGLADVFGDHMVLQRGKPVPVWGWTKDAGQKVTVEFHGQTKTAVSDEEGRWEVTLDPMPAGGPFVLELDGRPAAYDVMLGDVWLCSGQSNMEMGVDKLHGEWAHAPEVPAEADHPHTLAPASIAWWRRSSRWLFVACCGTRGNTTATTTAMRTSSRASSPTGGRSRARRICRSSSRSCATGKTRTLTSNGYARPSFGSRRPCRTRRWL
jgi:hypothetical protein